MFYVEGDSSFKKGGHGGLGVHIEFIRKSQNMIRIIAVFESGT